MTVTAALAERLGVELPQGAVTLEQLERAVARGFGARDMAAIVEFTEQMSR
jgi:3-hydroxyisobutyrate dehydrogenase-like beta-hydroxyacid dehydrogenase